MERSIRLGAAAGLHILTGVLALAVLVAVSQSARADSIDGDWCDGTRRISIRGPDMVTPGGNRIKGEYDRHDARFSIPAGETDAGAQVEMVLMGEEHVQVRFGSEPQKIWRRCKDTS